MTDRTTSVTARVPDALLSGAERAAREARPGISLSGVVRLALALLAGSPTDALDKYAANLPRGRQANRPKTEAP